MSGLGWANVPREHTGWNGHWGTVPVQGPVEEPCYTCRLTKRQHPGPRCAWHRGWVNEPTPEQIADAEVITRWACHACKAENDVWGEGAVDSWMECMSCGEFSFLVMA